MKAISLDVIDEAHATGKLLFGGFVVLDVLDFGQALRKSADVGRIIGERVIRKANPAGKISREEFRDCFIRKTESRAPNFSFNIHFRS